MYYILGYFDDPVTDFCKKIFEDNNIDFVFLDITDYNIMYLHCFEETDYMPVVIYREKTLERKFKIDSFVKSDVFDFDGYQKALMAFIKK